MKCREMSREQMRAYRRALYERDREMVHARYVAQRDEKREYNAVYRAANQERIRGHNAARVLDPWHKAKMAMAFARRRARKFGLDSGHLTKEVFARLHLLPCAYCGVMPALGADHVIPISRGGPNAVENLVPACLSCNRHKERRTGAEFRAITPTIAVAQ